MVSWSWLVLYALLVRASDVQSAGATWLACSNREEARANSDVCDDSAFIIVWCL